MRASPGQRLAAVAFITGAGFFAYAFVLRVAPSVMVDDLMAAFAASGAVLGNLSAFYFYAYSGLQVPVGMLLDRFGPRMLMSLSALIVAIGTLLFAWAEVITTAYAGRLLIGVGCAFSWAGTLFIVNRWFPTRFALLAGVSQMIAMGGAMLGQAPLALLVERQGWRGSMELLAVVGFVLALLLWLVVRDGQRPSTGRPMGAGTVVRNPQTWLCAAVGLAMVSPMLAFGALWGVPYLMSTYDMGRTEAAGIASMVFLGNGVGSALIGAWSDHLRRRKLPMFIGVFVCTTTTLAYMLIPGLPPGVLTGLVFVSGIGGAAMVLSIATALEHNPVEHAGLTVGVINMSVTSSGALLQPLIGWLLDRSWDGTLVNGARIYRAVDYQQALLIVPALGVVAMIALLAIRETHAKRVV